jgi:integrase/recombinase XerD
MNKSNILYETFDLVSKPAYVIDNTKEIHLFTDNDTGLGNLNKRKHTARIAKLYFGKKYMAKQAKTLTPQELRRVLDYVATRKHAARNRALLMMTHLSGMRVGEVASLRFSDILDVDGKIRGEVRLRADQTKGSEPRVVYINEKLRKELQLYIGKIQTKNLFEKVFYSQKQTSDGFSANTLTQFFHYLYKRAGVDGASSHSGRRTFITNLAAKGVSVRVLMSLAGHKNISTTQSYIDVNDEMLRGAVEMV